MAERRVIVYEIEVETEIEEDGAGGPEDLDLGLGLGRQRLRRGILWLGDCHRTVGATLARAPSVSLRSPPPPKLGEVSLQVRHRTN